MHKKILFFIIIACFTNISNSYSQTLSKRDSLKVELQNAKNDSIISHLYVKIADSYQYSMGDSAIFYLQKSREIAEKKGYKSILSLAIGNTGIEYHYMGNFSMALENYYKALDIREEIGDKLGMANMYNNIGIILRVQSNYEDAIKANEKALALFQEIGDDIGMSRAYNNIGIVYHDQGNYDKAVEYQFKSLKVNEDAGNKEGVARAYNNIGMIYQNQGEFDNAIRYIELSLKMAEEMGDRRGIAVRHNNLGNIYSDLKEYEKALKHHNESLRIKEESSDKIGMSASYTNIGNIHRSKGEYEQAIKFYLKSLKIDEEVGDKNGQAIVFNNIANLHLVIADSVPGADFQENINKALYYGRKSYDLAVEIGAIPVQNNTSDQLLKANKRIGNYKQALEYAEIYIKTNQIMFNDEKTNALTEMQTKYETEKTQQEIEKKNILIEKQEIDNKRQRNQRNFFIAGSVLLALLVLFVFKGYQDKKRSNNVITEKNAMLMEANEEINAQKEEIEVQHSMVIRQKEHIEMQKDKIESSIRYANRIQTAVLPKKNKINNLVGEHFVIFRPKDVVSGDFYWTTSVNNWIFVAVADCTGHGVPGAFMSMLGVSFLNEIVRKKEVNNPALVLNHLRAAIIEALDQTSEEGSQNDGMDITFLAINKDNNECMWAGAGLPIWIFRNNGIGTIPMENLEIIKPDKMTIAISHTMKEFTFHNLKLEKGDRVYMFTDGILDQFGGMEEKKFMSRQLKQKIADTISLSIQDQHFALVEILDKWINPEEGLRYNQIDDITLFGMAV
jgi:tetratricopeptide (TPR) repeat protein